MKVKVSKAMSVEIEIDVDFPIYKKSIRNDGKYSWYSRITEDMKEVHIIFDEEEKTCNIEISFETKLDVHDMDYALGKGIYACTEKEYHDAFEKALTLWTKSTKYE